MLKINVTEKTYQITYRSPSGGTARSVVEAESPAAALLRNPCPEGWQVVEVREQ